MTRPSPRVVKPKIAIEFFIQLTFTSPVAAFELTRVGCIQPLLVQSIINFQYRYEQRVTR